MTELVFMTPTAVGSIGEYSTTKRRVRPSKEPTKLGWDALDVTFGKDAIEVSKNHLTPTNLLETTVNPSYVYSVQGATENLIVYISNTDDPTPGKAYASNGASAGTEITRASGVYTGAQLDIWSGTFLNGIVVLTNNVSVPQLWNPVSKSTRLVDLTNWTVTHKAKIIVAYKNYLVAINITKNSSNFPTLIKWSNAAVPGSAPSTWDETDATNDAGEFPLSGTSGELLDAVPMKESLILYKTDSVWRMTWVGGQDVFRFDLISDVVGLYKQGCAKEYIPGWHVMITAGGEVVKHNGNTFENIGSDLLEADFREFWGREVTTVAPAEIAIDNSLGFAYFGYNRGSQGNGNAMEDLLIWNWEDDIWFYSKRIFGFLNMSAGVRMDTDGSVMPGTTVWVGQRTNNEIQELTHVSADFKQNGFFETDIMSFGGIDRNGRMIEMPHQTKLIKSIRPIVDWADSLDNDGGLDTAPVFVITLSVYEKLGGTPNRTQLVFGNGIGSLAAFDSAIDELMECMKEGTYYQIRFQDISDHVTWGNRQSDWRFLGFILDVEVVGNQL